MTQGKVRESNIELLRILAMLIIIVHHFGVHGVFNNALTHVAYVPTVEHLSWQYIITHICAWGGDMSNGIFVLITGFFMIGKNMNYKKILELTFVMFLYAWVISLVFYGGHIFPVELKELIRSIIPVWFGYNWFVACYIIFSLFIPFLNPFLNSLSKQRYFLFLLLVYFLYAIMPTFKGESFLARGGLVEFFFMYAIGGFLRLHCTSLLQTCKNTLWRNALLSVVFLQIAIILTCDGLGYITGMNGFVGNNWHFVGLFNVLISIAMFCYFATRKKFYSKTVNKIAASVLGIYLIHANPLVTQFAWNYILPNQSFLDSPYFLLLYISKVIAVFIICLIIDQMRINFLKPIYGKYISMLWDKINPLICQSISKVQNHMC